jgi:hypothetical protein
MAHARRHHGIYGRASLDDAAGLFRADVDEVDRLCDKLVAAGLIQPARE